MRVLSPPEFCNRGKLYQKPESQWKQWPSVLRILGFQSGIINQVCWFWVISMVWIFLLDYCLIKLLSILIRVWILVSIWKDYASGCRLHETIKLIIYSEIIEMCLFWHMDIYFSLVCQVNFRPLISPTCGWSCSCRSWINSFSVDLKLSLFSYKFIWFFSSALY